MKNVRHTADDAVKPIWRRITKRFAADVLTSFPRMRTGSERAAAASSTGEGKHSSAIAFVAVTLWPSVSGERRDVCDSLQFKERARTLYVMEILTTRCSFSSLRCLPDRHTRGEHIPVAEQEELRFVVRARLLREDDAICARTLVKRRASAICRV